MDSLYIVIPTIRSYKVALDLLLESLPEQWKTKVILIYQKEKEESFTVFPDGHIEVYLDRNIYEYGSWIGVNLLLENKIIPFDSWYLFLHDTCKCGPKTYEKCNEVLDLFTESEIDIVWLTLKGESNICLLRRKAITEGAKMYKNEYIMKKMDAIKYEHCHFSKLSPKMINVPQLFLETDKILKGVKPIYGVNKRTVFYIESIDLEKYYVYVEREQEHPQAP
jgi:hypothetical protein